MVFFSAIAGVDFIGVRSLPGETWNLSLPVIGLLSRWDSGWYIQIALDGYPSGHNPISARWAWFPLYPVLMRIFGQPLMSALPSAEAVALAGFLLSNTLFFVSLAFFYRLSEKILVDEKLAFISSLFFAFWPGSLFYSSVYSESLFMTLMLGAFFFLEKEKAVTSTSLGFLAGLTRPNGFLVAIPFLYRGVKKRSYRLILQSIIIGTSYAAFEVYGYFMTGIILVRETAVSTYWTQGSLVQQLLAKGPGYSAMGLADLFLVVLPFIYLFSHRSLLADTFSLDTVKGSSEAAYFLFASVAFIFTVLDSNDLFLQLHRYAVCLIPIYWVLARIWHRNLKIGLILLATLSIMLSIGTALFATWRWYL